MIKKIKENSMSTKQNTGWFSRLVQNASKILSAIILISLGLQVDLSQGSSNLQFIKEKNGWSKSFYAPVDFCSFTSGNKCRYNSSTKIAIFKQEHNLKPVTLAVVRPFLLIHRL